MNGSVAPSADKPLARSEQERFAVLIADGENASEAYIKAGIGMTGLSLPEVMRLTTTRVEWLRAQPQEPAIPDIVIDPENVSVTDIVRLLMADRKVALRNGQAAAAIRADELLAKLKGFFVDPQPAPAEVNNNIFILQAGQMLDAKIDRLIARRTLAN